MLGEMKLIMLMILENMHVFLFFFLTGPKSLTETERAE